MSVYVDSSIFSKKNGRVKYCHLTADSLEELHTFARNIGVKCCWHHISRKGIHHYDLNPKNRELAVKAGAKEI